MAESLKETILIVEDDADTRELCRRALLRQGFHVLQAESLATGLDCLLAERIDYVLLDYGLPDGPPWPILDVATSIQPRIPVIMSTGMGDERIAVESLRRGATDYIVKSAGYWELLPSALDRARVIVQGQDRMALLAAVVSASPDPIISTDIEGCITSWNEAAERLYGWRADEVMGSSLLRLVPEEGRKQVERAMAMALGGRRFKGRGIRMTRDGGMVPVASSLAPIKDPEAGNSVGLTIIEQSLVAVLRSEALQRQAEHLQRMNEELDQFAAVAAHDLQAPIRSAHLSLDLLAEDPVLGEEQQVLLRQAQASLHSARSIVQRVLQYARQACVVLDDEQDLDLEDIVQRACDNLQARIHEVHPDLQIDCPHQVRFDPTQLMQVIQNIVGNALQYHAPDRACQISIRSRIEQDHVFVDINDNGQGMSEADAQQVFRLFRRGSSTSESGSGIGLAVCKKLVEARGGMISVESILGSGTTFKICLPSTASQATTSRVMSAVSP